MRGGLVLIAAFVTAACAAGDRPAEQAAGPREPLPGCDAQAAAAILIGRARSETAGAQALERSGAQSLRWIAAGEMVTMDERPERLNIELDASGRVVRVRCG